MSARDDAMHEHAEVARLFGLDPADLGDVPDHPANSAEWHRAVREALNSAWARHLHTVGIDLIVTSPPSGGAA